MKIEEIRTKQEKLWNKAWADHDAGKITTKELRLVIIQINWDAQHDLADLETES